MQRVVHKVTGYICFEKRLKNFQLPEAFYFDLLVILLWPVVKKKGEGHYHSNIHYIQRYKKMPYGSFRKPCESCCLKHQLVAKLSIFMNVVHKKSYLSFSLSISASKVFIEDRGAWWKEGPGMMLPLDAKKETREGKLVAITSYSLLSSETSLGHICSCMLLYSLLQLQHFWIKHFWHGNTGLQVPLCL